MQLWLLWKNPFEFVRSAWLNNCLSSVRCLCVCLRLHEMSHMSVEFRGENDDDCFISQWLYLLPFIAFINIIKSKSSPPPPVPPQALKNPH